MAINYKPWVILKNILKLYNITRQCSVLKTVLYSIVAYKMNSYKRETVYLWVITLFTRVMISVRGTSSLSLDIFHPVKKT